MTALTLETDVDDEVQPLNESKLQGKTAELAASTKSQCSNRRDDHKVEMAALHGIISVLKLVLTHLTQC